MEYVTLKQLSNEFNLDRSNLRKYILKHGFTPVSIRTEDSKSQLTMAFSLEDAEAIRELRASQGFMKNGQAVQNENGYLYIIQVIPEFAPNRIKIGFAIDVMTRLSTYKTLSPSANLAKAWPCKKTWELAAIASITRNRCQSIASEVYECDSLAAVIENGDLFFALMP